MSGRRIVLTGGPSAGKTSLVEALAAEGFDTRAEAGRAIIIEQQTSGGTALPWADRQAYALAQFEQHFDDWHSTKSEDRPVFFDRGIPDVIGYLRLCSLDVPEEVSGAARECRYDDPVFIAPHWPEIFVNDDERRQSPGEAERTCETMRQVYGELGYELCDLPLVGVAERVEFILDKLG